MCEHEEPAEKYAHVMEIGVNQMGFTIVGDPKTTLVTYGMKPCIAIAGFEPYIGIGFTAHYPAGHDIASEVGTLLYHISRLTGGNRALFETRVKGGLSNIPYSSNTHEELVQRLTNSPRRDIFFEITRDEYTRDIRAYSSQALGINIETGEFIEYYRPQPLRESKPTSIAREIMLGLGPTQLCYFPQRSNPA